MPHPDDAWVYPLPSEIRCTVVDVDELLRCVSKDGHGWHHGFDREADQGLCLSWRIMPNGRLRFCALPVDHEDQCIYLPFTERRVTLGDVIR